MSYMRGDYYVWTDSEDFIHIWSRDGYDAWDDTIWAMNEDGSARAEGFENASGVSIPTKVLDQLVMMRLAQILEERDAEISVDSGLGYGNFGGQALERHAEAIKAALTALSDEVLKSSNSLHPPMNADQVDDAD